MIHLLILDLSQLGLLTKYGRLQVASVSPDRSCLVLPMSLFFSESRQLVAKLFLPFRVLLLGL
jgi:hypothetical protein